MAIIDNKILNKVKDAIYEVAELIKEEESEKNKLINNWNKIEKLLSEDNNDYIWPMSKPAFASNFQLNCGTIGNQIRKWMEEGILKKGVDCIIEGSGGRSGKTLIYESGAKKILIKKNTANSIKGATFLKKYYESPKCFVFIDLIIYAVKQIDRPTKEYSIAKRLNLPKKGDRQIDLYLEIKKLAIECDERGHDDESPEKRIDRQQDIINKLGCRFLRFNPHRSGFDIGLLLKAILLYLFDKEMNGHDPIDYYNRIEEAANPKKRTVVDIDDDEFI